MIVAYGGLVREPLLSAPPHGWINLHFSLLPRWRGAAPVQRALIAGDRVTGAAVFQLVPELDAGDVFAELEYAVPRGRDRGRRARGPRRARAPTLLGRGRRRDRRRHRARRRRRPGEPTLAPKLGDDDGRIRWDETREAVLARIRGVTPEPGAHTTIDGARLKILAARRRIAVDAPRLDAGESPCTSATSSSGPPPSRSRSSACSRPARARWRPPDWWRGRRDATPARFGS